ncbi:hypothetical protein SERLA73DRAFT_71015 [Serpula lacrymans var. lacrymans S7.3]|uniref:Uncharacterized protein n=2 Tax=Serpula lacrymans var. lacrymans TaxID=341189 RepID=F8PNX9_SERL3|nr:uncharacterized protein SERLADRAFT_435262 [Serpula lacrymans var. lacrymans S7.9]EGO01856.1 hypothetical protein SERLA73DRAFT_71015 [Serpula lacrymans var. lacrymans S7.3]EGO27483.1 hypothetical protein SERLADRAFT_435262 [Serpula lacrymans var. lacrymans S7.9]
MAGGMKSRSLNRRELRGRFEVIVNVPSVVLWPNALARVGAPQKIRSREDTEFEEKYEKAYVDVLHALFYNLSAKNISASLQSVPNIRTQPKIMQKSISQEAKMIVRYVYSQMATADTVTLIMSPVLRGDRGDELQVSDTSVDSAYHGLRNESTHCHAISTMSPADLSLSDHDVHVHELRAKGWRGSLDPSADPKNK